MRMLEAGVSVTGVGLCDRCSLIFLFDRHHGKGIFLFPISLAE
jgi:hypothetical protein